MKTIDLAFSVAFGILYVPASSFPWMEYYFMSEAMKEA